MSKVISNEMKALVKSSPFYLMMLVCAKDTGMEESAEAILKWEAENMPKFHDMAARSDIELPREAQLIKVVISKPFDRPFEADTLHDIIDEFLARVDATPELKLTEAEKAVQGDVREYYTAKKTEFANV